MSYGILKDPAFPLVDFSVPRFRELVARFGQGAVDQHVRFYVLPNGDHGGTVQSASSAEPVPRYVDLVRMATDWVEQGVAPPDAPVLRAMASLPPSAVSASRPMCRYPLYPHDEGGDVKSAASFRCMAP